MKLDNDAPFWKVLVVNIIKAVVAVLLVVIVINILLKIFTKHNHEIEVPDFTAMTMEEAQKVAHKANVRLDVVDSVFVRRLEPGAIFSQNPASGSAVKKGRRILITINATQPKRVEMPNLVGLSLRQAKTELYSRGLSIKRISYVSDIATNNVIEQRYNGRKISQGQQIESESAIELVLGLNYEDALTFVPYVCGYTLSVAEDNIYDNSLNVGTVRYDSSVQTYEDTLNAVVYLQSPIDIHMPHEKGAKVNLNLTVDQTKLSNIQVPEISLESEESEVVSEEDGQ